MNDTATKTMPTSAPRPAIDDRAQAEASGSRPRPKENRLAYVDALRGIAFFVVFLVHWSQRCQGLPDGIYRSVSFGESGVQLFFVVSALTILMSLRSRSAVEQRPVANFLIRRFFRIAPMFYVGLTLYFVHRGFAPRFWAPDGLDWRHLASAAAFLHGWHPTSINAVVPGGWSIAVEMTFYLLVPLLYLRLKTPARALIACAASLVLYFAIDIATAAWLASSFKGPAYLAYAFRYFWFPAQLPVFLMGAVLYTALMRDPARPQGPKDAPSPRRLLGGTLVFAAILSIVVLTVVGAHHPGRQLTYGAAYVCLCAGLAAWPMRIFVNRITCYLGTISYSGYLLSFAALGQVETRLPPLLSELHFTPSPLAYAGIYLLLTITLTVLAATITYHLVERPGIALGSKIIRKWEKPRR